VVRLPGLCPPLRPAGASRYQGPRFAQASCATIRLKLLKLAAWVTLSVRRIKLAMANAYPWQQEWGLAHARLAAAAR